MNLVDKWAQKANRGNNILSFYLVFQYSTSNSRVIIELTINLVKRSSVKPTCVSSRAYLLRESFNASFILLITPCMRIILLWTLFYAYFCIWWYLMIYTIVFGGSVWPEMINWKCAPYLFSFYYMLLWNPTFFTYYWQTLIIW